MVNKKNLNSKNLASIIENLLEEGKEALVMRILETTNFSRFSDGIKSVLVRRDKKLTDFARTKIYSNSQLSSKALQQIQDSTKIELESAEIIIDKTYSPGVVVQSGSRKIDATLSTVLQNSLR